jgi:hypothetical protein
MFAGKLVADPGKMRFARSPVGTGRCLFVVRATTQFEVFSPDVHLGALACSHFTQEFSRWDPSGSVWKRVF